MTTVDEMQELLEGSLCRFKDLGDEIAKMSIKERVSLGDVCKMMDYISEAYEELDFQMYCFDRYISRFASDEVKAQFKQVVSAGKLIEECSSIKWKGWHEKWCKVI